VFGRVWFSVTEVIQFNPRQSQTQLRLILKLHQQSQAIASLTLQTPPPATGLHSWGFLFVPRNSCGSSQFQVAVPFKIIRLHSQHMSPIWIFIDRKERTITTLEPWCNVTPIPTNYSSIHMLDNIVSKLPRENSRVKRRHGKVDGSMNRGMADVPVGGQRCFICIGHSMTMKKACDQLSHL